MYYSDKYDSIPLGIVDKKICGCGLSSYALENSDALVLVVPTVAMIKNKVYQYPNNRRDEEILGVYSGVTEEDIEEYILKTRIPKIMVTYDSFHKVSSLINTSYHIVIDEFSDLLDAYSYRDKAINSLFRSLINYPKVSYISATPIDKEFLPQQLVDLPYTELEWDCTDLVKVTTLQTTNPLYKVRQIVEKYRNNCLDIEVDGKTPTTAYFYVNSVTMIKNIIDSCEMLNSECRVICSNTPENKKKLGYYEISSANDKEKTFNFITSCAFKGIDIYSDSGLSFVVSNNRNNNTLVSIDTNIFQIAGRIRTETNPFRHYIVHIFNENPLSITKEEFNSIVETKTRTTNNWLSGYNKVNDEEKEAFAKEFTKESYLAVDDDGKVYFDELLVLLEKRIFRDVIEVYKNGLSINSFYEQSKRFKILNNPIIKLDFLVSKNAKTIIKKYCEDEINLEVASNACSIINETKSVMTKADYKRLGYQPNRIRNEFNNMKCQELINNEVKKLFSGKSGFYLSKDIKIMLSHLYKNLGVDKKAKANDIEPVLNVKATTKKIDKVTVVGYELI